MYCSGSPFSAQCRSLLLTVLQIAVCTIPASAQAALQPAEMDMQGAGEFCFTASANPNTT